MFCLAPNFSLRLAWNHHCFKLEQLLRNILLMGTWKRHYLHICHHSIFLWVAIMLVLEKSRPRNCDLFSQLCALFDHILAVGVINRSLQFCRYQVDPIDRPTVSGAAVECGANVRPECRWCTMDKIHQCTTRGCGTTTTSGALMWTGEELTDQAPTEPWHSHFNAF